MCHASTRVGHVAESRRGAVLNPSAIRQAVADFFESWRRVARKTRMPTREGVLAFFGNQVLVNAAAWTAGVIAAGLVKNFFEVKGFRNLWGLTASSSRSLVSADDYQMIMTLASYAAGLIMLIFMRHLIVRLIAEFHSLRIERARGDRASDAAPAESGGSGPLTTPDPNRCAPFAEAGRESGGRRVPAHSRIRVDGLELLPDDLADD